MLALTRPNPPLSRAEQFGLDVLVDCSRLLRTADDVSGVVELHLLGDPGPPMSLETGRAREWGIERHPGRVDLPRALLRLVTDIAGAAAEQRSTATDRHNRVPASTNPLVIDGSEREPVVQHVARRLREAVLAVRDRRPIRLLAPWPNGHRWAAALSHDVDIVALWPAFTGLRLVELAGKRAFGRAARVIAAAARATLGNPVLEGVRTVLASERAVAAPSTWFVLSGTPTVSTFRAGDLTYRPESPAARHVLQLVLHAGHEVALHGSFETFTSASRFTAQRQRLQTVTGAPIVGVRQHFLRMKPGVSQRAMLEAGFEFDSTFGFADRNGFRLGLADVVPAWSETQMGPLPLDEVPFTWMDRALSKYRGVEEPDRWTEDALELAASCRAVEGLWVGIWHPNLTPALGFPGAPAAYAALVQQLAVNEPWLATISQVVAWRRARRACRAVAVRPDGAVDYRAAQADQLTVLLEEADGTWSNDHLV